MVAAVLLVKSDEVSVDIPRDEDKSLLKGDSGWSDVDDQLGDREFELFTRDDGPGELVFPRNLEDCACPSGGVLRLSGKLEKVKLAITDKLSGFAGGLRGFGVAEKISKHFENFKYNFESEVDGIMSNTFGSTCADPQFELGDLLDVKVPVKGDNTICKLASGDSLVAGAGVVLDGISDATDGEKTLARPIIEKVLKKVADSDGCVKLDGQTVKEKAKERLIEIMDWSFCESAK